MTAKGSEPKTVLVVEDDYSLYEVLEVTMSRQGFQVQGAADAEQARYRIAAQRPDLIVLDLVLPGSISGHQLLIQLQSGGLGNIPVIVITGRYTDSPAFEAEIRRQPNVRDFIKKPLQMVRLLDRIHQILGTKPQKKAPARDPS